MKRCPACQRDYAEDVKFCPSDGSSLIAVTGRSGDPLVGAMFARKYEIVEKLGEGGFGSVYRARDVDLEVTVALKVAHAHLIRDARQFERFKLEARLLRRLGDKTRFVPRLYDYGRDDEKDLYYFSLEFCAGRSLQQLLIKEGPFEEGRAITLVRQVCTALSVAHRENPPVVHRDLKPDNLMLVDRSGTEEIKVLDFGIAKIVGEGSLTDVNRGMPGSYGFMSPEQLDGNVDSRTDLFAAGATMYHLVTGKDPWLGEPSGAPLDHDVANKVLLKTYRAEPIPPRQANPRVSKELEQLLLKLLQKRPEDRYQSATGLDEALEKIQLRFGMPVGGRLLVESHPTGARAKLIRNGSVVARGKTPWRAQQLAPGQYDLVVEARKHEETRTRVRIEMDEESRARIRLQAKTGLTTRALETSVSGLSSTARSASSLLGGLAETVEAAFKSLGRLIISVAQFVSGLMGDLARALRSRPARRAGIGILGIAMAAGLAYLGWEFFRPVDDGGQELPRLFRSVSQDKFYEHLQDGEVREVLVRGGTIRTRLAGLEDDTVTVLLADVGFQTLMRDLLARGVPVTSIGEPDLEIQARESGTGSEINEARIALESESVSANCEAPCPPGETGSLPPDWYAVGVDSDDWAVDTVNVRHAPGAWPEERVEGGIGARLYLAGGVTTQLDVRMVPLSQPEDTAGPAPGRTAAPAETPVQQLLRQAQEALNAGRVGTAYQHARNALQQDPGNLVAEGLIDDIAASYLRSGLDYLNRSDYENAIAFANRCLVVRPTHSQCQNLKDEAAEERDRAVEPEPPPEILTPQPEIRSVEGGLQFNAVEIASGETCELDGNYNGRWVGDSLFVQGNGRLQCSRGRRETEDAPVALRLDGAVRDGRLHLVGTVGSFKCELDTSIGADRIPRRTDSSLTTSSCTRGDGLEWIIGWELAQQ